MQDPCIFRYTLLNDRTALSQIEEFSHSSGSGNTDTRRYSVETRTRSCLYWSALSRVDCTVASVPVCSFDTADAITTSKVKFSEETVSSVPCPWTGARSFVGRGGCEHECERVLRCEDERVQVGVEAELLAVRDDLVTE